MCLLVALACVLPARPQALAAPPEVQPPSAERLPTEEELLEPAVYKAAAKRLLTELRPEKSVDAKVARLIDRLVLEDRAQVQTAATALLLLGRPAVPAIIRRIDDRRRMPVGYLSFENTSPRAFEGLSHYGVHEVVDALSMILSEITGESSLFLPIDFAAPGSGDLDRGRAEVVAGWRDYLARIQGPPRAPGKRLPPVRSISAVVMPPP